MSWTILGGFDPYDYNACLCSAIFRHHKVAQIYFNLTNESCGEQKQPREAEADMGSLV